MELPGRRGPQRRFLDLMKEDIHFEKLWQLQTNRSAEDKKFLRTELLKVAVGARCNNGKGFVLCGLTFISVS